MCFFKVQLLVARVHLGTDETGSGCMFSTNVDRKTIDQATQAPNLQLSLEVLNPSLDWEPDRAGQKDMQDHCKATSSIAGQTNATVR